ncbi:MAG: hypothetical protein IPH03_11795 [Tetrasphaera sp.]|nr:hypothetical protein [Tetrasphaera sp.]
MSVEGLIARGRAAHLRVMVDTCVITRAGAATMNTTTGAITTATASIYTGKCRLRGDSAAGANVRETDTGGAEQVTVRYALLLPYGSDSSVLVGDLVAIGSRTLIVLGRINATSTTAASLLVEEVPET